MDLSQLVKDGFKKVSEAALDAVVASVVANQDQHFGHLQDMQKWSVVKLVQKFTASKYLHQQPCVVPVAREPLLAAAPPPLVPVGTFRVHIGGARLVLLGNAIWKDPANAARYRWKVVLSAGSARAATAETGLNPPLPLAALLPHFAPAAAGGGGAFGAAAAGRAGTAGAGAAYGVASSAAAAAYSLFWNEELTLSNIEDLWGDLCVEVLWRRPAKPTAAASGGGGSGGSGGTAGAPGFDTAGGSQTSRTAGGSPPVSLGASLADGVKGLGISFLRHERPEGGDRGLLSGEGVSPATPADAAAAHVAATGALSPAAAGAAGAGAAASSAGLAASGGSAGSSGAPAAAASASVNPARRRPPKDENWQLYARCIVPLTALIEYGERGTDGGIFTIEAARAGTGGDAAAAAPSPSFWLHLLPHESQERKFFRPVAGYPDFGGLPNPTNSLGFMHIVRAKFEPVSVWPLPARVGLPLRSLANPPTTTWVSSYIFEPQYLETYGLRAKYLLTSLPRWVPKFLHAGGGVRRNDADRTCVAIFWLAYLYAALFAPAYQVPPLAVLCVAAVSFSYRSGAHVVAPARRAMRFGRAGAAGGGERPRVDCQTPLQDRQSPAQDRCAAVQDRRAAVQDRQVSFRECRSPDRLSPERLSPGREQPWQQLTRQASGGSERRFADSSGKFSSGERRPSGGGAGSLPPAGAQSSGEASGVGAGGGAGVGASVGAGSLSFSSFGAPEWMNAAGGLLLRSASSGVAEVLSSLTAGEGDSQAAAGSAAAAARGSSGSDGGSGAGAAARGRGGGGCGGVPGSDAAALGGAASGVAALSGNALGVATAGGGGGGGDVAPPPCFRNIVGSGSSSLNSPFGPLTLAVSDPTSYCAQFPIFSDDAGEPDLQFLFEQGLAVLDAVQGAAALFATTYEKLKFASNWEDPAITRASLALFFAAAAAASAAIFAATALLPCWMLRALVFLPPPLVAAAATDPRLRRFWREKCGLDLEGAWYALFERTPIRYRLPARLQHRLTEAGAGATPAAGAGVTPAAGAGATPAAGDPAAAPALTPMVTAPAGATAATATPATPATTATGALNALSPSTGTSTAGAATAGAAVASAPPGTHWITRVTLTAARTGLNSVFRPQPSALPLPAAPPAAHHSTAADQVRDEAPETGPAGTLGDGLRLRHVRRPSNATSLTPATAASTEAPRGSPINVLRVEGAFFERQRTPPPLRLPARARFKFWANNVWAAAVNQRSRALDLVRRIADLVLRVLVFWWMQLPDRREIEHREIAAAQFIARLEDLLPPEAAGQSVDQFLYAQATAACARAPPAPASERSRPTRRTHPLW